jgi:putative transposase
MGLTVGMPRANRYVVAGAAYHLTHRCHDRAFLLKFARDRTCYREMLREALEGSPVRLLSYAITSNHVHLLVAGAGPEDIARLMQAVQGRYAEAFNRRKKRQGAFWSDRYHATMIDGGEHLWGCLKYIDLNMVRAGVVRHPREWKWTAWQELAGERERYRLIDREALLARLEAGDWGRFRKAYAQMIEEALRRPRRIKREGCWTESIGVGSAAFVAGLEAALDGGERRGRLERAKGEGGSWVLREGGPTLGLYAINGLEKSA